jgi:hypothetical protein
MYKSCIGSFSDQAIVVFQKVSFETSGNFYKLQFSVSAKAYRVARSDVSFLGRYLPCFPLRIIPRFWELAAANTQTHTLRGICALVGILVELVAVWHQEGWRLDTLAVS